MQTSSSHLEVLLLADHSAGGFLPHLRKAFAARGLAADFHLAEWNWEDAGAGVVWKDGSRRMALLHLCTPAFRESFYAAAAEERGGLAQRHFQRVREATEKLRHAGVHVWVTTLPAPLERFHGHFAAQTPDSLTGQVHRFNASLRGYAAEAGRILILDVEYLAAVAGLYQWYDERLWHHAKYPCHPRQFPVLAADFARLADVSSGRIAKCLILDLDQTLWGGTIGDDGLQGIVLGGPGAGEAYREFQSYLKVLRQRGLLLCVCSKNDEETARLPFRHHDAMILKEEDIALFVANWEPKSRNIGFIATTLGLSPDSMVFLDDSPVERDEVRRAFPGLMIPELPEDPSRFAAAVEQTGFLEAITAPTSEDENRAGFYRQEQRRRAWLEDAGHADDHMASLEMAGRFGPLEESQLQRAAQLILRSNQFNPCTRRIGQEQLSQWIRDESHPCFAVGLTDRFGDYGLVSVICCRVDGDLLEIREWVMSCRVFTRGFEKFIMNHLIVYARGRNLRMIQGVYLPTEKNSIVSDLYSRLGFRPASRSGEWWLDVSPGSGIEDMICHIRTIPAGTACRREADSQ